MNNKSKILLIISIPIIIFLLYLSFIWYAVTRPYDHRKDIAQTKLMIPDVIQFYDNNKKIFLEIIDNERNIYDIKKYSNVTLNNIKIISVSKYFGIEFFLGNNNFTSISIYYKPDFSKLPRVVYKEEINEDWHIVISTIDPG